MADLKKVFIYVKADSNSDSATLKKQILAASGTPNHDDKVFFLADTKEIVTHGQVFGISEETVKHLGYLDTAVMKLTGLELGAGKELDGTQTWEITDDVTKSTIAKYVAKKMTTVSAATNSAVTVTPQDADGHKNYEVAVIADELTVVTKEGKLTSGLQLVYANKQTENKPEGIPADHPSMYLADKNGKIVGTAVDVNDFIVDGMISSVEYVAKGEDDHPAIKITWNTDGGNKVTYIPMDDVFKLEEIHTGNSTYITVNKTTPTTTDTPHPGDVDGGMCYEVKAVVDDTDLTAMSTVTYTPSTDNTAAKYTVNSDFNGNTNVTKDVSGLADAKKVADKIRAIDEKIVEVGNQAIARENTIDNDIKSKIDKLRNSLDDEIANRTNGDASLQHLINEINSTEEDIVAHPTSVNAKIAKLRDSLNAELHAQDNTEHPLVTVSLSQEAGKIKDLAVTAKVNTLMSATKINGVDGQITVNDKPYYIKDITEISKVEPSLVTIQDAWCYGQALMTTVKSDNNKYIKVENNDGKLMIQYEPWAEIHSESELNNLLTIKDNV